MIISKGELQIKADNHCTYREVAAAEEEVVDGLHEPYQGPREPKREEEEVMLERT